MSGVSVSQVPPGMFVSSEMRRCGLTGVRPPAGPSSDVPGAGAGGEPRQEVGRVPVLGGAQTGDVCTSTAGTLTAPELCGCFWADLVMNARATGKSVGTYLRQYLTPKEYGLTGWDWSERPKMCGAPVVSIEQQKSEWLEGIHMLELWMTDHPNKRPTSSVLGLELVRKLALIHLSHDKQAVQVLTPNDTIGGVLVEQALRRINPLRSYAASVDGLTVNTPTGMAVARAVESGQIRTATTELLHVTEMVDGVVAHGEMKEKSAQTADDGGTSGRGFSR